MSEWSSLRRRVTFASVVVAGSIALGACAGSDEPPVARTLPPPLYTCGDAPFRAERLSAPEGAEKARTEAARRLRGHIRGRAERPPGWGWRIITEAPGRAQFAAGGPQSFDFVAVRKGRRRWDASRPSEDCRPEAVRGGLIASPWRPDPVRPAPGPETTELSVEVLETHCTIEGGDARRQLQHPDVRLRGDAVEVTFFIVPRPNDVEDCLRIARVPYLLRLPEPLGDHRLLDGSRYPALDPMATRR